jgi:lipopolysaccharide export system protein LptA
VSTTARRWLRHGTSALIVLLLATMAVLALNRVRFLRLPRPTLEREQVTGQDGEDIVADYTGFEYVESIAGELIFALSSARTLGKSSGWHEIEGVQLQLYDGGVEGPVLTAEGASFNLRTRETRLRGPVHVEFPNGAILTTQSGRFDAGSRRFETDSEVLYMSGESAGQAGHAAYFLGDNRLVLTDNAVIRTADGVALRAPRIVYQRPTGRIVFPGGVRISSGGSVMEAREGKAELPEAEGMPNRIELWGGVSISSPGGPDGGAIEASMPRLVAKRESGGNWQIEAPSSGPWIEVRFGAGEAFYERSVQTMLLRGVISPDGILNLRAEREVCLYEIPLEGDPRRATARSARLWFTDGKASDVELVGEVELHGEGIEARAYRARMSSAAAVTMLHGDPDGKQRTILVSDRGRISCDQAQMFDREQRTEARGNVQGQMVGEQLMGSVEEEDQGPVHFAAELLEITDAGTTFRLRDAARLWQGRRLLLADDVRYRQSDETMEASGHVRMTLPAAQLDPAAAAGDDVMVVARSLGFDRLENHATFRGGVRYSDPQHILAANEVTIFFDDEDSITALEAVGAVDLVELTTGRRMTGNKARRDVTAQTIELTGNPVQLSEPNGNVMNAPSLTWDQASGSVTVAGGTETIYYPEEEP